MLRAAAVLVCLGLLALACGQSVEPSIAYRYEVRGRGSDVKIAYLTEEAGLVERTVTLPWTSQEFLAIRENTASVEAHGPPGSNLRCVVRYRLIPGEYGGNGPGNAVDYGRADDSQSQCDTGPVHFAPDM
jgi:hypothetical protein